MARRTQIVLVISFLPSARPYGFIGFWREKRIPVSLADLNMEDTEICEKPYVWFIERPFIKKESFF